MCIDKAQDKIQMLEIKYKIGRRFSLRKSRGKNPCRNAELTQLFCKNPCVPIEMKACNLL